MQPIHCVTESEAILRATKASAAVERLNKRCPEQHYSMVRGADGLFHLVEVNDQGVQTKVSEPMEQDDFVRLVNSLGPQTPKRVSKLDVSFEDQLRRTRR